MYSNLFIYLFFLSGLHWNIRFRQNDLLCLAFRLFSLVSIFLNKCSKKSVVMLLQRKTKILVWIFKNGNIFMQTHMVYGNVSLSYWYFYRCFKTWSRHLSECIQSEVDWHPLLLSSHGLQSLYQVLHCYTFPSLSLFTLSLSIWLFSLSQHASLEDIDGKWHTANKES